MSYFLATELPRLAGWGTAHAAGLARAEEDYFSAHERRGKFAPREPSEPRWEAANREAADAEARALVHVLKMSDPAAFADLDREYPLRAFLRRRWSPPAPGEFLASLEEALPIVRTVPPDLVRLAEDFAVLEMERQPPEPIPIGCGSVEGLTANQRSVFDRLVREEGEVERRLIDEISLWYSYQVDQLAEVWFGRHPGEVIYLPEDPSEDDFRRLTLIREIHLAPSTCRLAVVYRVPYVIDFEHGGLMTALVDEFEYISLGDVSELIWLV